MQTMSSRDFNQYTNKAIQAAKTAPIIITYRGKPAYVLLSYADYQKLTNSSKTALEQLQGIEADASQIPLDIPPRSKSQRPIEEFE